jgi:peptidoglycan/LPS O-acetylase OafA/YrhL
MASSPRRIPSLDGLRGLSILLVLCGHLSGIALPDAFDKTATLGVTVFFVISGYLITGLLIRERERTGHVSLRMFYLRRTLRIFPAFYAFVIAACVMKLLGAITLRPGDLLAGATYTMNYHFDRAWPLGHLWSLAVEEQFYLLWPAALAFLGVARGAGCALAAVVIAPILRVALFSLVPSSRGGLDQMFPTVADGLATGCLLAYLHRRLEASSRYIHFLSSPFFLLAPAAIVASVALGDDHPGFDNPFGQTLRNIGIALVLDYAIRFPTRRFGRLLNAGPIAFIGTISYSLYLWQQPFINRHATHWINGFPQNVLLAAACAVASYFLVERPVLAWRDRLVARRAERVEPSLSVHGAR